MFSQASDFVNADLDAFRQACLMELRDHNTSLQLLKLTVLKALKNGRNASLLVERIQWLLLRLERIKLPITTRLNLGRALALLN